MNVFELFLLFWVLPSLVVFLGYILVFRLAGDSPETPNKDDMTANIVVSVFWPLGAALLPFFLIFALKEIGFGDTLFKEREWRDLK